MYDDVCINFEADDEILVIDSKPLDGVEADDKIFEGNEDGICSVDKDDFCLDVRAGNESSVSVSDALDSADDNMDDSCDVFSNDEAEDDNSFVENEGCNSSEQDDLDCFSSFLELDKVWTFERKLDKSEYLG